MPAAIPDLDVFYVVYRPDLPLLRKSLQALADQQEQGVTALRVYLWDNSIDDATHNRLTQLVEELASRFASLELLKSPGNLGFGRGNNRLLQASRSPWVLLLNQDAIPEPGALREIAAALDGQPDRLAALELRQIPFEHPKEYNPSTLITPWVSGAACLLRREALEAVGGFDEGFFMYAEDVDLSWRLRAAGWQLKYLPRAAVVHDTYTAPDAVKPLQAVEGTFNNLIMRARYGTVADIAIGLLGVLREVLVPPTFPGRRWQFLRLYPRFLRVLPSYWRNRIRSQGEFRPDFRGWNFARHREGAFWRFLSAAEWQEKEAPLVSIIVRTHKRPQMLREALLSLAHQTYSNLEVVVVEDGAPLSRALVEAEFNHRLNLKYLATGDNVGRSAAGNLGLREASGTWLGFLDDDDQVFADHVEVLVQQAQDAQVKGVYAIADEVLTDLRSVDPVDYTETDTLVRYRQPFSRVLMWHHNYLPIQSVLFHRDIYEKHGGFAEDMDQLEDWDLWVRYTLEDDFLLVDKTTSRYRVPACSHESASRVTRLDAAYRHAKERQAKLTFTTTPKQFIDAAEEYRMGLAQDLDRRRWLRHTLERLRLLPLARRAHRTWLRMRGR